MLFYDPNTKKYYQEVSMPSPQVQTPIPTRPQTPQMTNAQIIQKYIQQQVQQQVNAALQNVRQSNNQQTGQVYMPPEQYTSVPMNTEAQFYHDLEQAQMYDQPHEQTASEILSEFLAPPLGKQQGATADAPGTGLIPIG